MLVIVCAVCERERDRDLEREELIDTETHIWCLLVSLSYTWSLLWNPFYTLVGGSMFHPKHYIYIGRLDPSHWFVCDYASVLYDRYCIPYVHIKYNNIELYHCAYICVFFFFVSFAWRKLRFERYRIHDTLNIWILR